MMIDDEERSKKMKNYNLGNKLGKNFQYRALVLTQFQQNQINHINSFN